MNGTRRGIERLLVDYASAVDTKDWDRLDAVFTPDAVLDFRPVGGRTGSYLEMKPWLEKRMAGFEALHHQIGNVRIDIDPAGLTASSQCYVRAVHGHRVDGALVFFEIGGVYEDLAALVPADSREGATDDDRRWRLVRRTLQHRFTTGTMPAQGAGGSRRA
jgi:hypothetical protein